MERKQDKELIATKKDSMVEHIVAAYKAHGLRKKLFGAVLKIYGYLYCRIIGAVFEKQQ